MSTFVRLQTTNFEIIEFFVNELISSAVINLLRKRLKTSVQGFVLVFFFLYRNLVLFFNLACFKSIRTSKNHVRKGRKKQSKVKSQVCLQKEKKKVEKYYFYIFFCKFFFAKTIGL